MICSLPHSHFANLRSKLYVVMQLLGQGNRAGDGGTCKGGSGNVTILPGSGGANGQQVVLCVYGRGATIQTLCC